MAWFDWSYTAQLNRIEAKIDALTLFVHGKRKPNHFELGEHIQVLSKKGKIIMSGSANVTTDHDLRVPLIWKDDVGTVSAPTSGTTATSDNAAIATVDVAADDLSIVVRSVAVGTANIAVANGALTDTIAVNVTVPAATVLAVDATDAVLVAKGTAA